MVRAVARACSDDLRQVLEVHLVADARARRHHAEVVEPCCAQRSSV